MARRICSIAVWALLVAAFLGGPIGAVSFAADAEKPVVIVISMDGVRHDYPARQSLPGMERMAREGARAARLVPVFPSSTFPNHVALATGARADRHGIVDNVFWDTGRQERFSYGNDASWLEAEPLWAAAERQGVRSAVFFWVASETDWRGIGASYRVAPFDDAISEQAKLEQIRAWLDLPDAERPQLIMTWWHGADQPGHRKGPDHPDIAAALALQDEVLQALQAEIDARGAWGHTSLLLVSDHGMTNVGPEIDPRRPLVDAGVEARLVVRGSHVEVFLQDPADIATAAEAYRKVSPIAVYRREEVPEALRFRHPTRTGDLTLLTEPPFAFVDDGLLYWLQSTAQWALGWSSGGHGYDPDHPDMGAIFFAMGRGVAPGRRLREVRAIDVAPTVAALLGIDPPAQAEGRPLDLLGAAPP